MPYIPRMPDKPPQSLYQRNVRCYDVPLLIFASGAALVVGLSLPFMSIKQLIFWEDEYTLFTSIRGMWESEHYALACLIFFFSIVFPFAKVLALAGAWYVRMPAGKRERALHWLGMLGKWSMLDVFVIAILIVLTQSKGVVDAQAQAGLYVFALAILLSMVASVRIERLAKMA